MSRWKFKEASVTAGENTVTVRQLKADEQAGFLALSKAVNAGTAPGTDLPKFVAKCGVIPPLSDEEVGDMPTDLMTAIVSRVMALSGLEGQAPKKEPTTPALVSIPSASPRPSVNS